MVPAGGGAVNLVEVACVILVTGDSLLDGRSAPIPGGAVLVDGDRIRAVGTAKDLRAPSVEERRVKGTILPGLLDCHTHVCLSANVDPGSDVIRESPARTAARAMLALRRFLRRGVTCIRDVGGVHGIDVELARAVRDGLVPGPRMTAAGRVLCMTGGHGHFLGIEVDSADEARRAARAQMKAGAGLVKLIATGGVMTEGVEPGAPQLCEDEMRAACEEAHKAGRRVAAHAQGNQGIRSALAAGVDTIEHGFFLDEPALAAMKATDATLVPTFAASKRIAEGGSKGVARYMIDKIEKIGGAHVASFQAAVRAGVRVACGTDAGTPFNVHGDLVTEILAFRANGLSEMDAIRSATSWAAEAMGRTDVGVLEAGRFADLAVVEGEPLQDLSVLGHPSEVWLGGARVDLSER